MSDIFTAERKRANKLLRLSWLFVFVAFLGPVYGLLVHFKIRAYTQDPFYGTLIHESVPKMGLLVVGIAILVFVQLAQIFLIPVLRRKLQADTQECAAAEAGLNFARVVAAIMFAATLFFLYKEYGAYQSEKSKSILVREFENL